MGLDKELAAVLRASARPVTVKQLKKRKVSRVQVIERSRFMEALNQLGADEKRDAATRRRIERLVQEVEKLGHDKKGLEHARGLVEAERSRLQSELDAIAGELGRETGQKAKPEDVAQLLASQRCLRDENRKTKKALERLQAQAQQRLDEALTRSNSLKQNLEKTTEESVGQVKSLQEWHATRADAACTPRIPRFPVLWPLHRCSTAQNAGGQGSRDRFGPCC